MFFSEFVGRDRPRQLALNSSTTEYHLKNVAHDTEYVLTLYVLFGPAVGPGISATFRTCEYQYSVGLPLTLSTAAFIFLFFLCKLKSIMQSQNVMKNGCTNVHWQVIF